MSRHRFQLVEVVERGRPVAVIKDTKSGRIHWVRRQGQQLLEWDKLDRPVENGLLRFCARTALEAHQAKRLESTGKPCRKCGAPFRPKGTAKTCPGCLEQVKRENGKRAGRAAA